MVVVIVVVTIGARSRSEMDDENSRYEESPRVVTIGHCISQQEYNCVNNLKSIVDNMGLYNEKAVTEKVLASIFTPQSMLPPIS